MGERKYAPTTRFSTIPEWLIPIVSGNAIKVYAILDRYGDGRDSFPSLAVLAEQFGASADTVRRAIRELEKADALLREDRHRDDGGRSSNLYSLRRDPARGSLQKEEEPPSKSARSKKTESFSRESESLTPFDSHMGKLDQRELVKDHWLGLPGMTQHRSSYFDDKVNRKIDNAVKKYGVDDVEQAMTAYAEILASSFLYWSHRWTLGDFLARGLDKFVPEADPYEVFKTKAKKAGTKTPEEYAAEAREERRRGL